MQGSSPRRVAIDSLLFVAVCVAVYFVIVVLVVHVCVAAARAWRGRRGAGHAVSLSRVHPFIHCYHPIPIRIPTISVLAYIDIAHDVTY